METQNAANVVQDAHDPSVLHPLMMFTTDIALKVDPEYKKITTRFLNDPKAFEQAFARAWFKLTHRDMGPAARYIGNDIPKETFIWQDLLPSADYSMIDNKDIQALKSQILDSGISSADLVKTAWLQHHHFVSLIIAEGIMVPVSACCRKKTGKLMNRKI